MKNENDEKPQNMMNNRSFVPSFPLFFLSAMDFPFDFLSAEYADF